MSGSRVPILSAQWPTIVYTSAMIRYAMVAEYAGAGMTWWLETLFGLRGSVADNKARILAGPPAF